MGEELQEVEANPTTCALEPVFPPEIQVSSYFFVLFLQPLPLFTLSLKNIHVPHQYKTKHIPAAWPQSHSFT